MCIMLEVSDASLSLLRYFRLGPFFLFFFFSFFLFGIVAVLKVQSKKNYSRV
jgi:hypothetical protein